MESRSTAATGPPRGGVVRPGEQLAPSNAPLLSKPLDKHTTQRFFNTCLP